MNANDLIRNLEHEYYSIQAANPSWELGLWAFLIGRGVDPDDIWGYSPQIGYDAGQEEPEWL